MNKRHTVVYAVTAVVIVVIMTVVYKYNQPNGASERLAYEQIVPGAAVSLTYLHGGSGTTYRTEKQADLQDFAAVMRASFYKKTEPEPWTGGGTYTLYDANGERLTSIALGPRPYVMIDGVYYTMTGYPEYEMGQFMERLLTASDGPSQ